MCLRHKRCIVFYLPSSGASSLLKPNLVIGRMPLTAPCDGDVPHRGKETLWWQVSTSTEMLVCSWAPSVLLKY